MQTALLLLPEILLIALGYGLRRKTGWADAFWDGLERLIYYVLFPALLFVSILRTPFSLSAAGPAILITCGSLLLAMLIAWLALPLLRAPRRQWSSGFQCAFRFNSFIAFALVQRLYGDAGTALVALLIGVGVPLVNLASVVALMSQSSIAWHRELLRNPLVLATAGGLACNLIGLQLPEPVSVVLGRLGAAALALGLLSVGVSLFGTPDSGASNSSHANEPANGSAPTGFSRLSLAIWLTTIKLLILPAIAWFALRQAGIGGMTSAVVVLFCAMPTSSTAAILANRMGGDGAYVARLITLSTVAALISLPFWLSNLR